MATQITADLPTLDFPREIDYPTQEDWAAFSAAAELNFGILGGDWSTQMQLWKDQANAMSIESNNNADIAQSVANYQGDWVSQGYTLGQTVSVGEVYYICKLTHTAGQNPTDVSSLYWNLALGNWNLKVNTDMSGYISKSTPVDADLIPLSDSVSIFGIKKLSWANLKATLKTYFDALYNFYNPTPTLATGTATFTATTNNINLTGIGVGAEIGDVIQISGAIDAKNNSEFTIEAITDANNIIVNQAHANKGTTKNVAARSGDTGVTVKLLAKWYNAPLGLGQDWVDVTTSRAAGTTYPNYTNRSIVVKCTSYVALNNSTYRLEMYINGNIVDQSVRNVGTNDIAFNLSGTLVVPNNSTYKVGNLMPISWYELR